MSVPVIMRILKNTDNYSVSLTTFLRYNLHAINCTCLKCTTSCILTHVYAYDIVIIKLWVISIPLVRPPCPAPSFHHPSYGTFLSPFIRLPYPAPSLHHPSCGTFLSPLCRPPCLLSASIATAPLP